ncbi:uncharacterized protein LOC124315451 [Daphnia pulicaria]|uniref:uncharacterized protein LOC124315451 n=1 Tax=Daphnia pulicaria TaxID=35523 RepID=UPI001EEBC5DF|nr:uncharacterized protein LOC124315451 [Daphnia pulicaria]
MFRIKYCHRFVRFCHRAPRIYILASALVIVLFALYQMCGFQICNAKYQLGKRSLAVSQHQFQNVKNFNSACSHTADMRGPHQKIIAYSIYGDFSRKDIVHKYLKPFRETLSKIPYIYPGWTVRIYHNLTTNDDESWEILKNTLDLGGSHVDLCNATEIIKQRNLADIFAMTWRWLPLLDDMVDTLMSRDSDSQIIPREQDAVNEWLASDRIFHIMRDHHWHCRFIVGCCWGVKVSQDRSTIVGAARKMFTENHLHEYDYDQKLLDRLIWPVATTNMMAHDSYCCKVIPEPSQPYPTRRKNGLFIGYRAVPEEELQYPCPKECRPTTDGFSEWNFC